MSFAKDIQNTILTGKPSFIYTDEKKTLFGTFPKHYKVYGRSLATSGNIQIRVFAEIVKDGSEWFLDFNDGFYHREGNALIIVAKFLENLNK